MDNNTIPELAWKMLAHAGRTMPSPFKVFLSDSKEPLLCHEIIRIIPGKRLVAFGTWGDKEVVAKLFYERGKAKRHLKRDVAGIDALLQANVPTPALLYQGDASHKRIQVLLFERMTQAKNLESLWLEQRGSVEFVSLMHKVIIELATQHVLGILQRDLHLKNFLVSENKIYTLDGGGIEKFPAILDKKQSLDNLSLFFAQLGVGSEQLQTELFKIYAKLRGWSIKQADLDFLQQSVARKNNERWQRFQKKIFRSCSAFVRLHKFNQSIVYDREYRSCELHEFFKDPEKIFSQPGITLLKAGRTATVIKVQIGGQTLVIKRYNIKNSWHWLRRCLRATRAAASWRLAQRLRLFGITTARPVAYIENHFFGLRGKSYFVMEYVAGQNIGEFFAADEMDEEQSSMIATLTVAALQKLAELKITHGDLKKTNILLAQGNPVLIDLDGMHEHATTTGFKRAFKHEINRFMRNWENQPKTWALFNTLLK